MPGREKFLRRRLSAWWSKVKPFTRRFLTGLVWFTVLVCWAAPFLARLADSAEGVAVAKGLEKLALIVSSWVASPWMFVGLVFLIIAVLSVNNLELRVFSEGGPPQGLLSIVLQVGALAAVAVALAGIQEVIQGQLPERLNVALLTYPAVGLALTLLFAVLAALVLFVARAFGSLKGRTNEGPRSEDAIGGSTGGQSGTSADVEKDEGPDRPNAGREDGFEYLHPLVLSLGLAAGISAGLLAFIHELKSARQGDLYDFIISGLVPPVLIGLMLAILVAVGSVVFLFERNIATFMQQAKALVTKAEDGVESLRRIPEYARSLSTAAAALHGLKHDLKLSHPLLDSNNIYTVSFARHFTSTLHSSPLRGVLEKMAISYWLEEAYDAHRLKFVTNPRNYTAFLLAAVRGVVEYAKREERKVCFYTFTSARPCALFMWPIDSRGHGCLDLVSWYLRSIGDLRKRLGRELLDHRRHVVGNESFQCGREKEDELSIVPIVIPNLEQKYPDLAEALKCDRCRCAKQSEPNPTGPVTPLFSQATNFGALWNENGYELTKELFESTKERASCLVKELSQTGDLGELREYLDRVNILLKSLTFENSVAFHDLVEDLNLWADEVLFNQQKLDSLGGDILDASKRLEEDLLIFHWLARIKPNAASTIAPVSFRKYFVDEFQDELLYIDKDSPGRIGGMVESALEMIGGEFALVGTVPKEGGGEKEWICGVRSEINAPWTYADVEIVRPGEPREKWKAMMELAQAVDEKWNEGSTGRSALEYPWRSQ